MPAAGGMEKGSDVLLDEVRSRYDAEAERHSQLYARVGVYLAVLAIYANALIRFFETPPPEVNHRAWNVFIVSCGVLAVLTVAAFSLLIIALIGKKFGYSSRPTEWRAKYDEFRAFARESLDFERMENPWRHPVSESEIQERLAEELKLALAETLGDATETNIQNNGWRYSWLHWASHLGALGFVPLVICIVAYGYMTWKPPSLPTEVKVVAPVAVRIDTDRAEVCVTDHKKPPVRPSAPPPEYIRDGTFPKPRPQPPKAPAPKPPKP